MAARHRRRRDHHRASAAYIPKRYAKNAGLWDAAADERGFYLAPRSANETRSEVKARDLERRKAEEQRHEDRRRQKIASAMAGEQRRAEEAIFGKDAVERMRGPQ